MSADTDNEADQSSCKVDYFDKDLDDEDESNNNTVEMIENDKSENVNSINGNASDEAIKDVSKANVANFSRSKSLADLGDNETPEVVVLPRSNTDIDELIEEKNDDGNLHDSKESDCDDMDSVNPPLPPYVPNAPPEPPPPNGEESLTYLFFIRNCFLDCSAHGFPRAIESPTQFRKIAWTMFTLCSIGAFVYQVR